MAEWTTACPDWRDRIRAGRSIIPPPIFPERAEEALAVFRQLRIVDAPGSPTFGESCAQWVFDLVASIFGSYDAEEGRRLITEWFVLIPKKNSKSTIAAGIMLTAQILNWRQSAEFAILAPTVEIANNSFGPARDMIQRDADLDALMHVQQHTKTITHRESGAMLKVVAADSNTVGGKKSVGTLIDELWLFGSQSNAENMLREATGGLASRPEGFVVKMTTQSDDAPSGVFKRDLDYARAVRDGKIVDRRLVPVIYEFPPEMVKAGEHKDPKNFWIVNPNFGYSVDREYIEREFSKAENDGEASMRGFLAKHLNVEIGLALSAGRWAGAEVWESCGNPALDLDALLERSEVVAIGIDGGGLDDWLAMAVIGREPSGKWLHWTHAWAHPKVLSRHKGEAGRFKDFERDGDLTIVESLPDDVSGLVDIVMKAYESGLLTLIGLDPAKIGVILRALQDAGIPEEMLAGIAQGWKLYGAMTVAERRLAEGAFEHGGSRMMAWTIGNARVEPRGNAALITKQASGSGKIDPVMAMLDAVEIMARNPAAVGRIDDFLLNPVIS